MQAMVGFVEHFSAMFRIFTQMAAEASPRV
jgi:hypothetical protein